MLVELPGLVIRCFEDRCTSHGGLGGRNDGKVLAGEAE